MFVFNNMSNSVLLYIKSLIYTSEILDFKTIDELILHKCVKKENHNYNDCLIESFEIKWLWLHFTCCDYFFFTDVNRDFIVLAHNGADYDNKLILQCCLGKRDITFNFHKIRVKDYIYEFQ